MPIESYWRGQTVPFHGVWTADSGNATGTTATLTLKGPGAPVTVALVTATSGATFTADGEWNIPDTAASVGLWSLRWDLNGAIEEAAEAWFYVRRSLAG